MDILTVSFFGHRHFNNACHIENVLKKHIYSLLQSGKYIEFLIGRNGDFDIFAASVIRQMQRKLDYGNSSLTLVLPYMTAEYKQNEQSFLCYYDDVEICQQSCNAHFKSAIYIRNKYIIDRSDIVYFCLEHDDGGAFKAFKHAEKTGKKIIDLANDRLLNN